MAIILFPKVFDYFKNWKERRKEERKKRKEEENFLRCWLEKLSPLVSKEFGSVECKHIRIYKLPKEYSLSCDEEVERLRRLSSESSLSALSEYRDQKAILFVAGYNLLGEYLGYNEGFVRAILKSRERSFSAFAHSMLIYLLLHELAFIAGTEEGFSLKGLLEDLWDKQWLSEIFRAGSGVGAEGLAELGALKLINALYKQMEESSGFEAEIRKVLPLVLAYQIQRHIEILNSIMMRGEKVKEILLSLPWLHPEIRDYLQAKLNPHKVVSLDQQNKPGFKTRIKYAIGFGYFLSIYAKTGFLKD